MDDDALPLLSTGTGKMTRQSNRSRPMPIMRRRQSVAAFGSNAEFSLPGGSIDTSNRASSLSSIVPTGLRRASSSGIGALVNDSSSQSFLQSSNANVFADAPPGVSAQTPAEAQLYDTLVKSLNKRRQSLKMNQQSLMSIAAVAAASDKSKEEGRARTKSVCFADAVKMSDGRRVSAFEYDYDDEDEYDDYDDYDEDGNWLHDEEEELIDDEERRKRTLARMKRRKEDSTVSRIRRYGYDPLNPPSPKSWAEWSMQRRDYQHALSEVLQFQRQPQLSTAALKGRKESVAFVREELLDVHLNKKNENPNLISKRDTEGKEGKSKAESKKTKDRRPAQRHHAAQLSDTDMDILRAYYYHWVFTVARMFAIVCNLAAVTLIIVAAVLPIWIKIPHQIEPGGAKYLYQLTLFQNCTILLSRAEHSLLSDLQDLANDINKVIDTGSVSVLSHSDRNRFGESVQTEFEIALDTDEIVRSKRGLRAKPSTEVLLSGTDATLKETVGNTSTDTAIIEDDMSVGNHTSLEGDCSAYSFGVWQTFVIGVMAFALLFSLLGFFLTMCGSCNESLPKRLYYYHSSAEILFVSAVLTGIAVIYFPLGVRYKMEVTRFFYGPGFFTGIISTTCYFLAGGLLNLDHFIICMVPAKEQRDAKRHRR